MIHALMSQTKIRENVRTFSADFFVIIIMMVINLTMRTGHMWCPVWLLHSAQSANSHCDARGTFHYLKTVIISQEMK